ncbi:hypothetical protein V1478_009683 [Vespula squamosa]|uniref:Uncharacterized protein n=1 Tax=Vespula squamosa TaxID=30214 RepID=A0ABD2AQN1_VESSQ
MGIWVGLELWMGVEVELEWVRIGVGWNWELEWGCSDISDSSTSSSNSVVIMLVAITPPAIPIPAAPIPTVVVDILIASTKQGTILGGPIHRPPQPSENLFGLRIFYVSEENPPNYASRHVNIDSTVTSCFSAYREVGQFLRQEKRNEFKS